MVIKLVKWGKKPPSVQVALAYQVACLRLFTWFDVVVKKWEKQPISRRKLQLIVCLAGLLLLGSISVYYTATGHFFSRITQKHHEQQRSDDKSRRK